MGSFSSLSTSLCLCFSCRDSSFSPPSPLCFIYSPWFTWDWWSSPLIVVITPVLLLQCIMHNRLTKHRRGQGQIGIHWPLDACWETLNRESRQGPETMADLCWQYLAPLVHDWCVKTETRTAFLLFDFNVLKWDLTRRHVSSWRWLLALLDPAQVSGSTFCCCTDFLHAKFCGVRI